MLERKKTCLLNKRYFKCLDLVEHIITDFICWKFYCTITMVFKRISRQCVYIFEMSISKVSEKLCMFSTAKSHAKRDVHGISSTSRNWTFGRGFCRGVRLYKFVWKQFFCVFWHYRLCRRHFSVLVLFLCVGSRRFSSFTVCSFVSRRINKISTFVNSISGSSSKTT